MALGRREAAWIETWDRAGRKMTVGEQASAPWLLLDAFEALEELDAQVAAHEAEQRRREAESKRPGVFS